MWRIHLCFLWRSSLELNGADRVSFHRMQGSLPPARRPLWADYRVQRWWCQSWRERGGGYQRRRLFAHGLFVWFLVTLLGSTYWFNESSLRSEERQLGFKVGWGGVGRGVFYWAFMYQEGHLVFKRWSSDVDHVPRRDRPENSLYLERVSLFSCGLNISAP